jgi:hypothetical protein
MPSTFAAHRMRRSLLLAGAAALTPLVAMSPAAAQSAASAPGERALANEQTIRGADQEVDGENSNVFFKTPAITGSALRLDNNALTMAAMGNEAHDSLAADGLAGSDPGSFTLPDADEVSANGGLAIANRQSVSDSITGTVPFGSTVALDGGAVSGSSVSASGNTQEGTATANSATDSVAAEDAISADIANYQSVDGLSQTSGRAAGTVDLRLNSVAASQLANSGNIARGIGIGNDVATTLTASGGATDASSPPGASPMGFAEDPAGTASYGILTNQVAGGLIKGRAGSSDGGPAFRVGVSGSVTQSRIAVDGNSLAAAGYANHADNKLSLSGTSVAGAGVPALGDITDVQTLSGAVKAFAAGGSTVELGAGTSGSSLSVSSNSARAAAAGNLASDVLSANAVSIRGATPDSQYANARVTPSAGAQHEATFGVQTEQDFGTSNVSAWLPGSVAAVAAAGPLDRSGVTVDNNIRSVAASGNSAIDGLAIDAGDIASTGALNIVQAGNGSVSATLGAAGDLAGSRVTAAHLADSSVSVSNNDESATAAGNYGSATMTVAANRISGFGAGPATAGALEDGYGATGAFVLAANQKLGAPDVPGAIQPSVVASVNDRSGVTVLGGAVGSTFAVDGNNQRADALGNNGTNRLSVAATSLDGNAAPSALSSSQYGQAAIAATSNQLLVVPGTLVSSRAEMSGNANTAYATVNNVDNALSVDGVGTGIDVPSYANSHEFGPPAASGDAALSNQQFAAGTLDARATSLVGAAGKLTSSQLSLSDNVTLADAAANRVQNEVVSSGIVSDGAALANTQINDAAVHAVAATDLRFTGSAGQPALADSMLTVDGYTTSAAASGNVVANEMTIGAGIGDASGALAGQSGASIDAPAALLNHQVNLASVSAEAGPASLSAPLNGATEGSRLEVTNNTSVAIAYGNRATNTMNVSALGAAPAAKIVSVQSNSGAVSAVVTGATFRGVAGPIAGSLVSLSGNQISAAATGNFAVGAITAR